MLFTLLLTISIYAAENQRFFCTGTYTLTSGRGEATTETTEFCSGLQLDLIACYDNECKIQTINEAISPDDTSYCTGTSSCSRYPDSGSCYSPGSNFGCTYDIETSSCIGVIDCNGKTVGQCSNLGCSLQTFDGEIPFFSNTNLGEDGKWKIEKVAIKNSDRDGNGRQGTCNSGYYCGNPIWAPILDYSKFYTGNPADFKAWACECGDAESRTMPIIPVEDSSTAKGNIFLEYSSNIDEYTLFRFTTWVNVIDGIKTDDIISIPMTFNRDDSASIWIYDEDDNLINNNNQLICNVGAGKEGGDGKGSNCLVTSTYYGIYKKQDRHTSSVSPFYLTFPKAGLYKIEVYLYNYEFGGQIKLKLMAGELKNYFSYMGGDKPTTDVNPPLAGTPPVQDCGTTKCGEIDTYGYLCDNNQLLSVLAHSQSDPIREVTCDKTKTMVYATYSKWLECTQSDKWIHNRAGAGKTYSCLDGTIKELTQDTIQTISLDGKDRQFILNNKRLYACGSENQGILNTNIKEAAFFDATCQKAGNSNYCHKDGKFKTETLPPDCGKELVSKFAPDGTSKDRVCVPEKCYTGLTPQDKQCVDVGTYFTDGDESSINLKGDDYCEGIYDIASNKIIGTAWASRTKQVALKLLEFAKDKKLYTLYCDYEEYASNQDSQVDKLGKICVLKYPTNQIAIGGTLDFVSADFNPTVPIVNKRTDVLNGILSVSACSKIQGDANVRSATNDFENCGDDKLWYYNNLNLFVYNKNTGFQLNEGIFSGLITWIKGIFWSNDNTITDILTEQNFDRLYVYQSTDTNKYIIGFIGKNADGYFIKVAYKGFTFSTEMCSQLTSLRETNCAGAGSSPTTITISIQDIENKDDYYPIWQSLTSKLRPN